MNFVGNNALDLAILASLIATDGILDGAVLGLYQNEATISRSTVRGSLTDATYTGNGDEAITWLTPSISDGGIPELVGTVGEFRPTDVTVGNTIFGCMLLNDADGLLMAAAFDSPAVMAATTDSLLLTVRVRLTANGLAVSVS